jgi:hypothetical protein
VADDHALGTMADKAAINCGARSICQTMLTS